MMEGQVDFNALPFIATYLELQDIDATVQGLLQIREYQNLMKEMGNGV